MTVTWADLLVILIGTLLAFGGVWVGRATLVRDLKKWGRVK